MAALWDFAFEPVSRIIIDSSPKDILPFAVCDGLSREDITMQTESIKEAAHRLLENLPDSATWEDLMYRIYVRQAIEAGLKDSNEGRTVDVKEVRKQFGLSA
jgi:hypothetical protein